MEFTRLSRFKAALVACLWLSVVLPVCHGLAGPMDLVPSMEVVRSRLALTAEQEAQLKPLFEKRIAELQQMQAKAEQATSSSEASAVQRDAQLRQQAFDTQVERLLTTSQKYEWRELSAGTREKLSERAKETRESAR